MHVWITTIDHSAKYLNTRRPEIHICIDGNELTLAYSYMHVNCNRTHWLLCSMNLRLLTNTRCLLFSNNSSKKRMRWYRYILCSNGFCSAMACLSTSSEIYSCVHRSKIAVNSAFVLRLSAHSTRQQKLTLSNEPKSIQAEINCISIRYGEVKVRLIAEKKWRESSELDTYLSSIVVPLARPRSLWSPYCRWLSVVDSSIPLSLE